MLFRPLAFKGGFIDKCEISFPFSGFRGYKKLEVTVLFLFFPNCSYCLYKRKSMIKK